MYTMRTLFMDVFICQTDLRMCDYEGYFQTQNQLTLVKILKPNQSACMNDSTVIFDPPLDIKLTTALNVNLIKSFLQSLYMRIQMLKGLLLMYTKNLKFYKTRHSQPSQLSQRRF
jgi:hypothetical protein